MQKFVLRFLGILFIVCVPVLYFACNNKNQSAQNTNSTTTTGGLQNTQVNSVTSASVKANDAAQGNSGMEKFATKEAKDPIAFDVRGDKLESVVNDTQHNISFGAPRTYQTVSYSTLPADDISRKFTQFSSPEISISPVYSFSNGQNSLVVSLVKFPATQTIKQFVEKYEALNKQRFASAAFTTTAFKNRNIPMTQFFIQEAESGLFRIVFPSGQKNQMLQFDYTIRRNSIQTDMERIEPSIGSIIQIASAPNQ